MVETVELEARRTSAGEAVAAEQLVLHALEHPGVMVVARCRRLAIGIAHEHALAGKADATEDIGRPIGAPPQPAIGAVERVIIFARLGRPGPDAALGAPD